MKYPTHKVQTETRLGRLFRHFLFFTEQKNHNFTLASKRSVHLNKRKACEVLLLAKVKDSKFTFKIVKLQPFVL